MCRYCLVGVASVGDIWVRLLPSNVDGGRGSDFNCSCKDSLRPVLQ